MRTPKPNQSAVAAMKQSFMATWHNWLPLLLLSVAGIGVMILGAIPLGLGLLIALPVLTAANYLGFRDLFGRQN